MLNWDFCGSNPKSTVIRFPCYLVKSRNHGEAIAGKKKINWWLPPCCRVLTLWSTWSDFQKAETTTENKELFMREAKLLIGALTKRFAEQTCESWRTMLWIIKSLPIACGRTGSSRLTWFGFEHTAKLYGAHTLFPMQSHQSSALSKQCTLNCP